MGKSKVGFFWSSVLFLAVIFGIVKWIIPMASRKITGFVEFTLPVPGTLIFIYMTLALITLFLYITFSDEGLDEFLAPVKKFLAGDYGTLPRTIVLVLVPLIAGFSVYDVTVPKVSAPVALRIQHPSSNFPKAMESVTNPLEAPSDDAIKAFIDQAKANEVTFIEQVQYDVDDWLAFQEDMGDGLPENTLEFFPTEPMVKFLSEIKSGNDVSMETARLALREKNLFEGRALYAMNCRPCHGDSVAGDGPMADGFKSIRPINFTDNGTIETIVEGYAFWRIENGGPGLPVEATPWDSAMPIWKLNLTEEQRWKILMGEYDLAEKGPRIPEKHETGEKHETDGGE